MLVGSDVISDVAQTVILIAIEIARISVNVYVMWSLNGNCSVHIRRTFAYVTRRQAGEVPPASAEARILGGGCCIPSKQNGHG